MKAKLHWGAWALAVLALGAALPAAASPRTLAVEVWTDRGDDAVYRTGDAMQVKVRANDDAYLLVYEIDANGKVSVLYPWRRGSNMVEGRRTYRLPPENSGYELAVENATGQGYIVAIASRRPFRDLPWYLRPFDPQGESVGYENRHDDEDGFDEDGNVVGDPMVAMERVRRRVLDRPSDTDDFASSYASYYVGHEVRYPRYLCADCHRPGQWAWWDGFDPYYARCSVFDFRVNWNWCWGPCIWNGYVPYYYYVVRSDCPPRYYDYYQDRSRWSSWDGYQRFNSLWGNQLVRHKTTPPPGYTPPPPPGSKPVWAGGPPPNGGTLPPGYLPPGSSNVTGRRGGGFVTPQPIGRGTTVQPGTRPSGDWRGGERPRGGNGDTQRPPVRDGGIRPTPYDSPRQETPRTEPRREAPRQESPRQESPRQEAPRVEPRREAPPAPRQEAPRQEAPRVEPRREEPRHETPRQEPPARPQQPERNKEDGPRRER